MNKILWFDTETTGLDPVKNDIIQIAYLIDIDGKIACQKNLKCRPGSVENITQEAIDVHGISIDEMMSYPGRDDAYWEMITDFSKYINKFDKTDKFYPGGYNVGFDLDFLAEFFKKCNDKYFGSWQNWYTIDPYRVISFVRGLGIDFLKLENLKLETVADYMGIALNPHDAMSDIQATRELANELKSMVLRYANRF